LAGSAEPRKRPNRSQKRSTTARMPRDLTFVPAGERAAHLESSKTSEIWIEGKVASRAELARSRQLVAAKSPPEQQRMLDWRQQPVGGRAGAGMAAAHVKQPNPTFQQSTQESPLFESKKRSGPASAAPGAAGIVAVRAPHDGSSLMQRAPDFTNAAGMDTAAAENKQMALFDGGPKGRRTVSGGGEVQSLKGVPVKTMHGAIVR
jgi:hypothetical protein